MARAVVSTCRVFLGRRVLAVPESVEANHGMSEKTTSRHTSASTRSFCTLQAPSRTCQYASMSLHPDVLRAAMPNQDRNLSQLARTELSRVWLVSTPRARVTVSIRPALSRPKKEGIFSQQQPSLDVELTRSQPWLRGQSLGRRHLVKRWRRWLPRSSPLTRDSALVNVIMHGAPLPWDAPLADLMAEAAYPDGWLNLVVYLL